MSVDAAANYQGNYGLVVKQQANVPVEQYAQTAEGFGDVYALDFDWNITDDYGIGSLRPQGAITLTETDVDGSLYFYNNTGNIPAIQWYYRGFQQLQNSSWDSWHKVSVIRNGTNSGLTYDGNSYYPLTGPAGGLGKIKFGLYFATKNILTISG
ncbi:MAG: hypothetical protein IPH45_21325 [Bacteroidales bacterium]|nr:hypothetical protein [Bacteroidales bacterium]